MQGQKRFSPELFCRVSPEDPVPRDRILGQLDSDESMVKDGTIGRHYDGQADVSKMGRRRQRCLVSSQRNSITDPDAPVVLRKGRGRQAAGSRCTLTHTPSPAQADFTRVLQSGTGTMGHI